MVLAGPSWLDRSAAVHVLLEGDPASGKSQLLQCVARLPHTRYAVGGMTTSSGMVDFLLERSVLASYGATLIAVSSLFNGLGRIVWGAASERLGRINTFRLLLASQLIVFGILMTEHNPWVFAILVCYVLSCFGGGFAIMPSMVIDVYGPKRMSRVYGVILTAWSAAGILGPLIVASLKDNYPDRAILYSFLFGILVLGIGFIFSFLAYDDRFIPRRILLQVFAVAPPTRNQCEET